MDNGPKYIKGGPHAIAFFFFSFSFPFVLFNLTSPFDVCLFLVHFSFNSLYAPPPTSSDSLFFRFPPPSSISLSSSDSPTLFPFLLALRF